MAYYVAYIRVERGRYEIYILPLGPHTDFVELPHENKRSVKTTIVKIGNTFRKITTGGVNAELNAGCDTSFYNVLVRVHDSEADAVAWVLSRLGPFALQVKELERADDAMWDIDYWGSQGPDSD
ncbi:MAG: hypothetical protein ABIA47_03195 [bacterium]